MRLLRMQGLLAGLVLVICGIGGSAAIGQETASTVEAVDFEWRSLQAGFEIAEMPLRKGGAAAGRVLLARFDAAKFRFTLHNEPSGRPMKDWLAQLGALMVINGGFFLQDGTPATPMLSEGVLSGPKSYQARHGAFISSPDFTGVVDLRQDDWSKAFQGAQNAAVSFPLLLAADGGNAVQPSSKSADRSFVAQDNSGRIILGTTEAYFTLPDFALFLKDVGLDLKLALNLDGGPYGCQAIAHQDYSRSFCGMNAPASYDETAKRPASALHDPELKLPIVLAVTPK